ncbi:MAG TPA: hypothetical protein PLC74_00220 [Acetobacteraceae bacterium]|nr:hypothetical protein [Acetobacteraceae bacterium]
MTTDPHITANQTLSAKFEILIRKLRAKVIELPAELHTECERLLALLEQHL